MHAVLEQNESSEPLEPSELHESSEPPESSEQSGLSVQTEPPKPREPPELFDSAVLRVPGKYCKETLIVDDKK